MEAVEVKRRSNFHFHVHKALKIHSMQYFFCYFAFIVNDILLTAIKKVAIVIKQNPWLLIK